MLATTLRQTRINGKKYYPHEKVELSESDFKRLSDMGIVELYVKPQISNTIKIDEVGIVVLLSGNKTVKHVQDWLRMCDVPCKCSLYFLDSSGCGKFGQRIKRWLGSSMIHKRYNKQVYLTYKPKFHLKKTDTVAELYNQIIPFVSESYILTLEDDIEPPRDGLKRLIEDYPQGAFVFGMPYESRHGGYAVSFEDVFIRAETLPNEIAEVKAVGGGFTLWADFERIVRDRPYKGWDDWLCARIRQRGGKVFIHSKHCKHYHT